MKKEAWELTLEAYVQQELQNNKYADQYSKNQRALQAYMYNLKQDWTSAVEERAWQGRIPTKVIDSYLQIHGRDAFYILSKCNNKGTEGYIFPEGRYWLKSYNWVLEHREELGIGYQGAKAWLKSWVDYALEHGEEVPYNTLKLYGLA